MNLSRLRHTPRKEHGEPVRSSSLFSCEGPYPASKPASASWRWPIAKLLLPWPWDESGGAEETRTPDFRLAKAALSQLSYGPLQPAPEWWAILDSNQRPQSYQDCALTS